jgi:predicted  nucleic acid-binding Zn-ribbon protein
MASLKAGLVNVSAVSRNQGNLEGRVSRLEGKVEQWEEVLNKIKHFDFDTHLEEEVEFMAIGSQAILSALNQRIDGCSDSNTYLRSRLSRLEESMKSIGDKNVELQDTINSLRKAAERGGANFKSSLAELKKMQENFSSLQTEMETHFTQGLTQCRIEHGE